MRFSFMDSRFLVFGFLFLALISCSGGVETTNNHSELAGLEWQRLTLSQSALSESEDITALRKYLTSKGEDWESLVAAGKVFISIGDASATRVSPMWEGTWVSYHMHIEHSDTFPIACGRAGTGVLYHTWKYLSRHDGPGCFDDKGHVLNRCLYSLGQSFSFVCE